MKTSDTMPGFSVPFDGCYWVVPGRLLAGPYPGSLDAAGKMMKLRGLLQCGIRRVIDLTEKHEVFYYTRGLAIYEDELEHAAEELQVEVRVVHFPIVDMDVPPRSVMVQILDCIDAALGAASPVFVHCWGGLGRTGTVVGCYLARHNLARGEKALDEIIKLRRHNPFADYPSPQTASQRHMIASWGVGE